MSCLGDGLRLHTELPDAAIIGKTYLLPFRSFSHRIKIPIAVGGAVASGQDEKKVGRWRTRFAEGGKNVFENDRDREKLSGKAPR